MAQVPVLDGALDAVATGASDDPFAVLGCHARDGHVLVRALLPAARAVAVVAAGRAWPMTRRHAAGLFEAVLAPETLGPGDPYRLRVEDGPGPAREIEDPYRFGPVLGDVDLHLFGEGRHYRAWERFGAHRHAIDGVDGVHFAVWAPNAGRVSVVGDFNRWDGRVHPMRRRGSSGIWEIFLPAVPDGACYKYEVRTREGALLQKADPFARWCEVPPRTASVVWTDGGYAWRDEAWLDERRRADGWHGRPMAVYEVHLGSWRRGDGNRPLTYRELAAELVPYARGMRFTHLELLPVMEHPFAGSWGYQVTGFFAPTSRFGTPDDFRYFVDECHRHGLGVILDWVPGHFPKDGHGLARFDGSALFEHADPRQGEHREWGTLVFNYGRHEVRGFLIASALYWLEEFHVDGLRVDAVASMLYLDYSREAGGWVPNQYGGRENLDAVAFLRQLNTETHGRVAGTITAAEESTAWPAVSRPVHLGGLGFTYKWNMGWMHDVLEYLGHDPVFRKYHHGELTFSLLYAFTENFVLPFSHDEVVHGKRSMLDKLPGDVWQKHATLRALYGFMYGHPGKKLLFMGGEFGQWREWNHEHSLDWHLLDEPAHRGLAGWVRDLNQAYQREPALFEVDFSADGFRWLDCADWEQSVIAWTRHASDPADLVVAVANFTPVPREGYRLGVPAAARYRELLNSDAAVYGGSNVGNQGGVAVEPVPSHGHDQSVVLTLPPLGCLFLKPE
jgi:1,4-alpha-glucan branching enzyme